jgi:hypothetical protein
VANGTGGEKAKEGVGGYYGCGGNPGGEEMRGHVVAGMNGAEEGSPVRRGFVACCFGASMRYCKSVSLLTSILTARSVKLC